MLKGFPSASDHKPNRLVINANGKNDSRTIQRTDFFRNSDRFQIPVNKISLLNGFESFIYETQKDDCDLILRVSHSNRRSENMILGEVDWIDYLVGGGVTASLAVPAPSGKYVEVVDDQHGGQFLATTFLKAPGGSSWEGMRWNDRLILNYGRLLGGIHALSKKYEPSHISWRRPNWDDAINLSLLDWIPSDQKLVTQQAQLILDQLQRLPVDTEGYGLIHQDAHAGNFFVDGEGKITLFDFDDCVYSWFIYDIAMVVFYLVTNQEKPEELAKNFWPIFWKGYRQENMLDRGWLGEIGKFFKFREIDLYAVIYRSMDGNFSQDSWVSNS